MTPNVKKAGAILALALAAAACSSDAVEPGAVAATDPPTGLSDPTTTVTTEAPAKAVPTTTTDTTDTAPVSLAFSSSDDLGRLFEIAGSVGPLESPGSDVRGGLIADGTVVQATNLRARDGVVWVRINSAGADRDVLGWVTSDALRPTTQSVEWADPDASTQFRQVSGTVKDDLLVVRQSPSDSAPRVKDLVETEVAMHGGNTVMTASGERWVDVIDSQSYGRLGWVQAASFAVLNGIEAKAPDGTDVDRRPDRDVSYGADISTGVVSATGCNAVQVTFESRGTSSGSAIVFGKSIPVGSPLDRSYTTFRWTATGGSTVYVDPGQTVTFTFPTSSPWTWYFTTLGADGQAAYQTSGGEPALNASGQATASDTQQFALPEGSCAPSEEAAPVFNDYWYALPDDERDAAIAQYEQELAEYEAANGGSAGDSTVQGVVEEAADDTSTSAVEEPADPNA